MTFAVALYVDGRFEGRVASSAVLVTKAAARAAATSWREAHAYKHDYRAVELDADDRLVWSDAQSKEFIR
jgi:hypothetical protein